MYRGEAEPRRATKQPPPCGHSRALSMPLLRSFPSPSAYPYKHVALPGLDFRLIASLHWRRFETGNCRLAVVVIGIW